MDVVEPSPAATEGIEAEFLYQFEAGAPEAAASALGIVTARMHGGVVLSMRNDVTQFWSKALGFGFDEPVTTKVIGDVLDFYRDNGDSRAAIQIAPSALPSDWAEIVAEHGLLQGNRTAKHVGRIDALQLGRVNCAWASWGRNRPTSGRRSCSTPLGCRWMGSRT